MSDEQYDETRYLLDKAVDKWLRYNGLTDDEIAELDYSDLDNELHYLLEFAQSKRGVTS